MCGITGWVSFARDLRDELTGLDKTGPIETFVPPIAFAILYGLVRAVLLFLAAR